MICKFCRIYIIYIVLIIPISWTFSQESHLSFYPLHIGDWWQYIKIDYQDYPRLDTTYYKSEIVGDTIVNGHRYFIQDYSLGITKYLRVDSSKYCVYGLSLLDSSEYIKYYLYASEGDTFQYGSGTLICIGESVKNIFGEEHNVKYFRHTLSWLIDITYSLCEGLGLVEYTDDSHGVWYEEYLIAAYIDSILYGNPSVVIDESNTIQSYKLYNNYPNPFNSSTIISYLLPQACFVKLSIYDTNGRLIKILVNEKKNFGCHFVKWNAEYVSSGVYFYKIDAGYFSSVKKCLVVN